MLSAYKNTAYVLLGGALCKAWQLVFSCFSLCALVKRCLGIRLEGKSKGKVRWSGYVVAPIWRDNVQVVGRAAWGRSCGSAKLLAGTLRCLRLCCWLPWDWSPVEQLGRCPNPHKGRCPLTPQGSSSLDPFARLSWLLLHALPACLSFWRCDFLPYRTIR